MKPSRVVRIAMGAALSVVGLAATAQAGLTKCTMRFSLEGWSAFYESASGSGTIRCDNGQSARVSIRAKGGGLSVGRTKIVGGEGRFSPVGDISELYGGYGGAEADAGMGGSATAQVVTKGTVSLALSGTGQGIDLGVGVGAFIIEKVGGDGKKRK
jgi:hypothetical protein